MTLATESSASLTLGQASRRMSSTKLLTGGEHDCLHAKRQTVVVLL